MCGAPHLVCVVREVDLVEDLGSLVLDGLYLHQVWGVLPGAISENTEGEREGSMLLGPHSWEAEETGNWPQPEPPPPCPTVDSAMWSPQALNSQPVSGMVAGGGDKNKGCEGALQSLQWGPGATFPVLQKVKATQGAASSQTVASMGRSSCHCQAGNSGKVFTLCVKS